MPLSDYKKQFIAYVNKDAFNDVQGPIDPLAYHSMFVSWATWFSVMYYEKMSLWMYISPICTTASAFTAAAICFISCVHYVQMFEIHLITECGTYLILMTYQVLTISSVISGKKYYHYLIQAIKDDFEYIATRGQKYREKFFENQRLTFKACIFMVMVTAATGIGMATFACMAVAITVYSSEKGAKRPLPFPFWIFGYDLHSTPVYEFLFVLSMYFTFCYTYLYAFMVQSHVIWIREITCKADIITWNLEDLLVDVKPTKAPEEKKYYKVLINHRMSEIIQMHHAMFKLLEDYAAVYKKCLFFEQLIASPIICLTAYCFAEKYEAGEIKILLLQLCIGSMIVVFVPNYLCTHLLEKVESVSDACWDMPFWNAGPEIRPYVILIMMRSMRPLPIAASGFSEISLKTYSNTISRAYSCFNMLRQADFNFN